MPSRSSHHVKNGRISSFFNGRIVLLYPFICLLIVTYVFFHVLAVINNGAVNTGVQLSFQVSGGFLPPPFFVFHYEGTCLGCTPRIRIAGLYGSFIFNFGGSSCCFLEWLCFFSTPRQKGSIFFSIRTNICYLLSFW